MTEIVGFVEPHALARQLQLLPGVISFVGGGGKTTLMMSLAQTLSKEFSVVVTTTTHIYEPKDMPVLIDPSAEDVRTLLQSGEKTICIGCLAANGKLTQSNIPFSELTKIADYILVEADGAKHLPLKAPADHEPVIPAETNIVIAVAGVDGIGKKICETVFRPERFAAILNKSIDATVSPQDAATILCDSKGQHKGIPPDARYCIVLNKVDTRDSEVQAEEIASNLQADSADIVLWTSFQRRTEMC